MRNGQRQNKRFLSSCYPSILFFPFLLIYFRSSLIYKNSISRSSCTINFISCVHFLHWTFLWSVVVDCIIVPNTSSLSLLCSFQLLTLQQEDISHPLDVGVATWLSDQRNINRCDVHRGVTISVVGLFSWASAPVMQRLGLRQPTGHWGVTDVKWACAQLSAWSQVRLIPTRLTETQLTYKCICEKYMLIISVWDFKVLAA